VRLSWGRASNPTTAARPMIDFSSGSSTAAMASAFGVPNPYGVSSTGATSGAAGGGIGYGGVGSADYNAWLQAQQGGSGSVNGATSSNAASYGGPYDPNSQAAYGFSGFPGTSPAAAATAAVVNDLGSLLSSVSTALTSNGKGEEKTDGGAPGEYPDDSIMEEDDDDIPLLHGDLGKASRLPADIARGNNEYAARHTHILLTSLAPIGSGGYQMNTIRDIIS
jgi:hypothetical protein